MKKSLMALATSLTITAACSKKDNPIKLSKEFLLGKWNLTFSSFKKTVNTTVETDTIYKNLAGNYYDFKANDTVYSLIMGDYDTAYYSIGKSLTGEDQISFTHIGDAKADILNIIQISKNQFTIYQKTSNASPGSNVTYEIKNILSR